jgi:hypothetical protein
MLINEPVSNAVLEPIQIAKPRQARTKRSCHWKRTIRRRMIEDMAQVHMTEAELARDLHAVLEQVRQGAEIIVERDATPVGRFECRNCS